ncbi:hypothetical protein [Teichococcus vastitatis]|jgi:predicted transcriptional regulator|uniref:Ribbon-helix-helix protein, copG family n=1 Tax=Teichococcus vastitatis TaxID=2307076 RepID=A0ABS9W5W3_9PROT|nr:hypothetical protein [Pseudoroseomonas vastitatis]MCI0754684.1 hypothetical protein [Pseudoroseomonas vastitatis]
MTEMTIELPDELAEAIEETATAMGTTPAQLLSVVLSDAVAEIPATDAEDWRYR